MNKLKRLIGALVVLALAVPALAQVTDQDVDQARQEVDRLVEQSADLGKEVIDAYGQQAALDSEIERLSSSIEFAQGQIADLEDRVEDLAVEWYMGSASGASLTLLFNASNETYSAGLEYLRQIIGTDEDTVGQLRAFRNELDGQTAQLADALDQQEALTADLEQKAGELIAELEAAQQVYDSLVEQQRIEEEQRRLAEEEAARRAAEEAARTTTTAASPATSGTAPSGTTTTPGDPATTTTTPTQTTTTVPSGGGGACPVAGAVTFTDTWGAPRSGGRTHQGVDMIAARGTPVVAVYSGSIYRFSNSTLGGLSIYFYSDAGDMYYYAHLDSFADVPAGQHVAEGTVIGYVGSTGNAPDWLPHLHWEYHPGGGAAVDPYPLAKSLCG